MPVRLLLEGRPGSGKTTAAARVVERLREGGARPAGFLTHEIREGRRRTGFRIEDLKGPRATLADVSFRGPPRVGRYGVDLEALERVALPALEGAGNATAVVIDELGKMELASERLREAVLRAFDGPLPVIATAQAARHPFTNVLRERPDVETLAVTARTRDDLPDVVVERVLA